MPLTVLLVGTEIAALVHNQVPEFEHHDELFFDQELHGTKHLVTAVYSADKPVGYMISFDRWQDGSLYIWMAAVLPKYRRKGALRELMDFHIDWAKDNGYKSVKIKTRNNRREMLAFLIKNGFNFLEVDAREDVTDNRILLEKNI